MELRRLGKSAVQVSPLGLGTAPMAGLGFREDSACTAAIIPSSELQS
jgi:aryl-alcohol dehydrogenase-like predicted oxidoreductase